MKLLRPSLCIDGRNVGAGGSCFVIAEIGVNHDGNAQTALDLVEVAASCGADAVKIQLFQASVLLHSNARIAGYQKRLAKADCPFELLRRYELSMETCRAVVERSRELGLIPLATPFSPPDMDRVEQLDLPGVKIASPDAVNLPLLTRAARSGKPLLISTGAATMDELRCTAHRLGQWKVHFGFLHCISSYPTPNAAANLGWIDELRSEFNVPIGYSDHTTSPLSGALAVAAGACIVERHLTHNRAAAGPDHAASSDPEQFQQYVELIREAEPFRGLPGKHVLPIEAEVRRISRQSLVVNRSLEVGQTLTEQDLTVQRPGTGLPAWDISRAVGRRVVRTAQAGEMLEWDMLADVA